MGIVVLFQILFVVIWLLMKPFLSYMICALLENVNFKNKKPFFLEKLNRR